MAAAAVHRDRLGPELTAANGEAARAFDDTVWALPRQLTAVKE
jgi:hypothetical protein